MVFGKVRYCPLTSLLSPLMSLWQQLSSLGIGGHWKGLLVGCLCYADDLALLAPSAYALRRMLKKCSEFADKRNLVFNAVKTQLICFHQCRSIVVDDCIEFCGKNLCFFDIQLATWATTCHATYLIRLILKTKQKFIWCANCLQLNFGMCCPVL